MFPIMFLRQHIQVIWIARVLLYRVEIGRIQDGMNISSGFLTVVDVEDEDATKALGRVFPKITWQSTLSALRRQRNWPGACKQKWTVM